MATTPKKNNFLKTWLPYILVVGVLIFIITYFGAQSGRGTALAPTAPQLISKIEQYAESTDKTCIATQDTDTGNFCKVEKFVINAENTGSQTIFTGSWQEKEVKVGGKTEKYTFTLTLSAGDDAVSDIFYALNVNGVPYKSINPNENGIWLSLLVNLLPTVLLIVGAIFVFRAISKANMDQGSKGMDFGKAPTNEKINTNIRFSDVAGCDEEKAELQEVVEYLKDPGKFKEMGARIPKGVILQGPPGTGKTLLAKAVSGEAGVPFFYISGSDFVEMFVGVGASRVRDLFRRAKSKAPSIIFIDEIDAVGRQRGAGLGGGNDEREQTLNQLLIELDGFAENTGVIVLAGTNRPDVLDPALLRPGRFDRTITVSLPDRKGRKAILEVHARNKKVETSVDFEYVAKRTPGFSGAELANVLNEAAIMAVRLNHPRITMADIDEGIDRVMGGPAKKSKKYSEHEKRLVAYHEAGHAIIGIKLPFANTVQKVTIIPRGDAGGYNLMLPEEETYFSSKQMLLAEITSFLGGRASEETFFDDISTGAHNDIERATRIARLMVTEFGMSDLGPIQYEKNSSSVFLGRDYTSADKNFSAQTATSIDAQISKIISECHDHAKKIISDNKKLLSLIAETLIREETLTKEDIDRLVKNNATIDAI